MDAGRKAGRNARRFLNAALFLRLLAYKMFDDFGLHLGGNQAVERVKVAVKLRLISILFIHIKQKRGEQQPNAKSIRQDYADKQGDDGNGVGSRKRLTRLGDLKNGGNAKASRYETTGL
jgi:hypothetical protein